MQILWVNMVTAVALGLTLAFEPTEPNVMRRPPRPAQAPLLTGFLVWRIVLVSLLMAGGVFGVFTWATEVRGLDLETARTLAVNTLVTLQIFYLFKVRYLHGPTLTRTGVLGAPAVLIGVAATVAAQLVFTYAPPLQAAFDTRPVGVLDGLVVIAVGVALMLALECDKALLRLRRHGRRRQDAPRSASLRR